MPTRTKPRRTQKRKSRTPRGVPPEPGIYFDVPFADYLAWPHINNTLLSHAARSMAHFRYRQLRGSDDSTTAQTFGRIVHFGTLEPEIIDSQYVVMPDFAAQVLQEKPDCKSPRGTNRYRELVADFGERTTGREILDQADYDALVGILESIGNNERATDYLTGGSAEVSIVWDDPATGLRCKARLDKWQRESCRAVDLKTTRDAGDFERAIANYNYHRQAAFYADGITTLTGCNHEFGIVAVETAAPYCVCAAPLSQTAIKIGRAEYQSLLADIADCRRSDTWPGYENPDEWQLPAWCTTEPPLSLTVNGQRITI